MTEAEWLASDDPGLMLEVLFDEMSRRRLRLLACACVRRRWHLLEGPGRAAIEVAELFADGLASWEELVAARKATVSAEALRASAREWDETWYATRVAAWATQASEWDAVWLVTKMDGVTDLLRDVAGNPFRPVGWQMPPNSRFRSDLWGLAYGVAREAYRERELPSGQLDPARLAVLADALEEAGLPPEVDGPCPACLPHRDNPCGPGCVPERSPASGRHEGGWTNCKTCNGSRGRPGVATVRNPTLAHLRSAGPHVRGCWAVDLVLGEELTREERVT